MTQKEKAEELVEQFKDFVATDYKYDEMPIFDCQKACAIIHVNEIISLITEINFGLKYLQLRDYYLEVKEEINKL